MKKIILLIALFILMSGSAFSQRSFLTYYQLAPVMQAAPGTFKFGLYGFQNPAITSYLHSGDMQITFMDQNSGGITPWGIFTGGPNGGFGFFRSGDSLGSVVDYRYSFAFGSKKLAFGLGYGFVGGDKSRFHRSNTFSWGGLFRPIEYLSVGFSQTYALTKNEFESVVDFSVRPFGDAYPLALYADASMFNDEKIKDAMWSGGVSWEVFDGFRLNGRYFSDKGIAAGIDISTGELGIGAVSSFNSDGKNMNNSYTIRMGARDRTIIEDVFEETYFLKMDLSGGMNYQNGFFDRGRTFYSTLNTIERAKDSKFVKGLIINFTNAAIGREMLWELREALQKFRDAGKKVIIFLERGGLDQYHFASVADKIVIDPLGMFSFEGYVAGRSFYKNMLEKAGIGYDEIRLFKYKSAAEGFAREHMSEADKEQRQALIDDWYDIAKNDITRSKSMSGDDFDKLVNNDLIYDADKLIKLKLADTTGRWIDCDKIIEKLEGKNPVFEDKYFWEIPSPIENCCYLCFG